MYRKLKFAKIFAVLMSLIMVLTSVTGSGATWTRGDDEKPWYELETGNTFAKPVNTISNAINNATLLLVLLNIFIPPSKIM